MAGLIPRFGIFEASRPTLEHAGDGVNYAFDITPVVAALEKVGRWDPSTIRITFVPHRPRRREQSQYPHFRSE